MKRVRITVTGDVQGVFYRHYAKKEAQSLGVFGWIRNESNGDVYIIAEGEDKPVDKFGKWAKTGSPLSEVENVEIVEEKYTGKETEFEVR